MSEWKEFGGWFTLVVVACLLSASRTQDHCVGNDKDVGKDERDSEDHSDRLEEVGHLVLHARVCRVSHTPSNCSPPRAQLVSPSCIKMTWLF